MYQRLLTLAARFVCDESVPKDLFVLRNYACSGVDDSDEWRVHAISALVVYKRRAIPCTRDVLGTQWLRFPVRADSS